MNNFSRGDTISNYYDVTNANTIKGIVLSQIKNSLTINKKEGTIIKLLRTNFKIREVYSQYYIRSYIVLIEKMYKL